MTPSEAGISLAFLADGAHAATPAFNGLFYATVATIIPVLYLAVAIQGTAYQNLLRSALDAAHAKAAGQSPWRPVGRIAGWIAPGFPRRSSRECCKQSRSSS
jgi:hypothetical protein